MRFRIRHATWYRYDRPVALGPHVFRMKPREDAGLRLDSFRLSLYPQPVETSAYRDAEGNAVTSAVFEGDTHEFRVVVDSAGENAYGAPGFSSAPAPVRGADPAALPFDSDAPELRAFLRAVADEAGEDPQTFLDALSGRMHASLRHVSRLTGLPLEPWETLRAGQGACRDLAALFLAGCSFRGIPARFVSGYLPAASGEHQHMHAWAEAFLPNIGWRAFDPTRAEGVGPEHIPVAAAADPSAATPIEGAFIPRGGPVRTEMIAEVVVETSL